MKLFLFILVAVYIVAGVVGAPKRCLVNSGYITWID
ncbi:hypothetical protein CVS40_12303 [Lucilia cuprina]|nr:hypothetical protein CVS40_12303 [Lucilia cuprina]